MTFETIPIRFNQSECDWDFCTKPVTRRIKLGDAEVNCYCKEHYIMVLDEVFGVKKNDD